LWVPACAGTTQEDSNFKHRVSADTASRSRGAIRPSFAINFLTLRPEGARKAGCALHPRSRVQLLLGKTHTSKQVQRRQSGFPCAVVYGLFRARPGDRAFLPPSSPRSLLLKNLTPASGRQDHTTSPSATAPPVLRRCHVHRIPRPTSVTCATPPLWNGTGRDIHLICISEKPKYFFERGWTDKDTSGR